MVSQQLGSNHLGFSTDDVLQSGQQVRDRDLFLDPIAGPVKVPQLHAGEVEHRFAQGLGRDRSGVDANATNHGLAIDDANPVTELRRHDCGLLTAGPRADDREVEIVRVLHAG
jgi:hypothetical protein